MPKNICNFNGCNRIIPGNKKYCEEHERYFAELKKNKNKRYDTKVRHQRDKQYTMFYHSDEWETLRDYIIKTYKGLDLFAYYIENRIISANTAHHIVELKDDWSLRLTAGNIFPVSDESHRKIHKLYRHDKEGTQKLLRKILAETGQAGGLKKV